MQTATVSAPPSADHARDAWPANAFGLPPNRVVEPGAQIEL